MAQLVWSYPTWSVVKEVLQQRGAEIMRAYFRHRDPLSFADTPESSYCCLEGAAFLVQLFTNEPLNMKVTYLEKFYHEATLPLLPGFIYHCHLVTDFEDHYFTLIYDHEPVYLGTYGGVPAITVKRIFRNLQEVLQSLLTGDVETYLKLFDIRQESAAADDQVVMIREGGKPLRVESFRYQRTPLYYPTLFDLQQILQPTGLSIDATIANLI